MFRGEKGILSHKRFNLWVTISRTRYAIFRLREAELKPYDVSPEQSAVLVIIRGLNDQATPAELARWLFRKPNTVSAILKIMEKKGLIKKSKDPYAKNIVRVSLTEKGEQANRATYKRESIDRIMSVLTEEECDCLQTCFNKMMAKTRTELGIDERLISSFLGVGSDKPEGQ